MNCGLAATFLALLSIVNFLLGKRRVLYPPFLYSIVWLVDVVVYGLSLIEINKVHAITWWVICLGALAFSVGGWLTSLAPKAVYKTRIKELSHPTVSAVGRTILVAICVACFPIFLFHVLSGAGNISGAFLINARQAAIDAASAKQSSIIRNPIMAYLPIFSIWTAVLCFMEARDGLFWIALGSSLVYSVMSTGRTLFLFLFCAIFATYLMKERKDTLVKTLRAVVVPFAIFFALSIGIVFMDKNISNFNGNLTAILLNYTIAYLVSPLAALDYVLRHAAQYPHAPNHTFEFLLKGFNALGYSFAVPPTFDKYVFVPYPTNTYTIYKPYFLDFGMFGMLGAFITIGLLQTFLYKRAIFGGKVSQFMSALLIFPLVMSFFDDAYSEFVLLFMAFGVAVIYFGFLNRLNLGFSIPRVALWRRSTDQERPGS